MQTLTVGQGSFKLNRFPLRNNQQLRAWDAADEYVLHDLGRGLLNRLPLKTLVVNDNFGALAVALAENKHYQSLQMMSDSWLSQQALRHNLTINGKQYHSVNFLNSLQQVGGLTDLVIIKIPKSLALLEEQLFRIRPSLHDQTQIIGAGMVRHIYRSTLKLFERIIGPTKTTIASKKARLIHCQFDQTLDPGNNPYPKHYVIDNTGVKLTNHANVFSHNSLDIGARFLMEHIVGLNQSHLNKSKKVVDLGCGNGLLGIIAAQRNPQSELVFCDESYMAIDSAKMNFKTMFAESRHAEFLVTDCLAGIPEQSVDLILNNPPFHIHHAISDEVARQMFAESYRALRKGGELWVIGNRHLGYQSLIKRLFSCCIAIDSNSKFVILRAVKD